MNDAQLRDLNNYQYHFGVPYCNYKYSIAYAQNPILVIKTPQIRSPLTGWGVPNRGHRTDCVVRAWGFLCP